MAGDDLMTDHRFSAKRFLHSVPSENKMAAARGFAPESLFNIYKIKTMKKLMLFAGLYCLQPNIHAASAIPSSVKTDASPKAGDRARAHFRENFGEVKNAVWYTGSDKNIYCVFQEGNIRNRVFYSKSGYWEYTLLSYPPSALRKDVKDRVQENFKSYHISYVNEIRSDSDEPVYIINIENGDFIKVIKEKGEDLEIQDSLEKQLD
jgi:hypothetical protein